MQHTQTFRKAEHLCLRKDIEQLFSAGSRSASVFPLRAVFRIVPHTAGAPVKVLISVSKRKLKHATDRNRAKRQVREAYRRHKQLLTPLPGTGLHLGFVWLSDRAVESRRVEEKLVVLLHRIQELIAAETAP